MSGWLGAAASSYCNGSGARNRIQRSLTGPCPGPASPPRLRHGRRRLVRGSAHYGDLDMLPHRERAVVYLDRALRDRAESRDRVAQDYRLSMNQTTASRIVDAFPLHSTILRQFPQKPETAKNRFKTLCSITRPVRADFVQRCASPAETGDEASRDRSRHCDPPARSPWLRPAGFAAGIRRGRAEPPIRRAPATGVGSPGRPRRCGVGPRPDPARSPRPAAGRCLYPAGPAREPHRPGRALQPPGVEGSHSASHRP